MQTFDARNLRTRTPLVQRVLLKWRGGAHGLSLKRRIQGNARI